MTTRKKLLTGLAGILGIAFVILAFMYLSTPANSLPSFVPGFDPALSKIHLKHGIASLLLGLACFSYVWFGTKKA